MSFTGKATYTAGATLPEIAEDVSDLVNDSSFANALTDTQFVVANASRFRAGDQIKIDSLKEVMLVTAVNTGTNTLTVTRAYGGTAAEGLFDSAALLILGNASLEGDDASAVRFTSRSRKTNYTQIFASTIEVSGSELAVRQIGVRDEL